MENDRKIYEYIDSKKIYFKKNGLKCFLIEKKNNNQISLFSRNISIYNSKTGMKFFSKDR